MVWFGIFSYLGTVAQAPVKVISSFHTSVRSYFQLLLRMLGACTKPAEPYSPDGSRLPSREALPDHSHSQTHRCGTPSP